MKQFQCDKQFKEGVGCHEIKLFKRKWTFLHLMKGNCFFKGFYLLHQEIIGAVDFVDEKFHINNLSNLIFCMTVCRLSLQLLLRVYHTYHTYHTLPYLLQLITKEGHDKMIKYFPCQRIIEVRIWYYGNIMAIWHCVLSVVNQVEFVCVVIRNEPRRYR